MSSTVAHGTCLTYSDRGQRNSSWQWARCTPVVGLSLDHHTVDKQWTLNGPIRKKNAGGPLVDRRLSITVLVQFVTVFLHPRRKTRIFAKNPKVQPEKGEASQNRNKNIARNKIQNPATVKENLSFANVLKGDHQMAPGLDAPSPANSEPEAAEAHREKSQPPRSSNANQTSQSKDDKAFGFMDAILELKKFFSDYPSLLDCFGLRITSWNANGVKSRIVELRDFIDKHSPDIVLIQETHLGPGDTLHIPNFTTYRNDRPTPPNQYRRGGTALLLKSSLPHYHTPTPPTGTVEATSVTLTPPGSQPIIITSLYISPTHSYHPIHSDLETIFSLGDVSIVCGDFNAHHTSWGCKRNDQRGKIIKNLIDTTNTQLIAPTSHTRFGYNSASIIDFALTRNLPWPSQVESIAELSSDHNPIMINLDTNTRFACHDGLGELPSPPQLRPPYVSTNHRDVEKQSADLTTKILNAHARSSKPVKQHKHYYVSDEIKSLMKERNRARKIWQHTRNPSDKRILNTLQNKIHRKVHAFQSKLWADDLRSLDPDDGSLWEMSEGLRKKKSPVYALNGRAGIAHTDSGKAEVLACSLESQFQDNNISSDTDYLTNRVVENYFLNENNFDAPLPPPMPSEILNFIKNAKVKRAPGREGITNKMLQNLTLPVIFQLTNIISNIFITGHFPDHWKTASVTPILKPGKPRCSPDSYRPISLLPVLSKITEKLILTRLNSHLTENNILISQQHGFRPRVSTSHQLLRVVEYIKTGFKDKKYTGAIFLDIQKAFDRVWHVGLLYKLIKINTPPPLIRIIRSFLTNRTFAVKNPLTTGLYERLKSTPPTLNLIDRETFYCLTTPPIELLPPHWTGPSHPKISKYGRFDGPTSSGTSSGEVRLAVTSPYRPEFS
ncbi:probable RNA-directed DNA polymerase from transposon X-element [Trichonephila clavipes]|nr:probable RNA-directed DNA polymerase from transposon X-element [Trichonephila clavipes]